MPSVAIIIVNWNGLELTEACLASLKKLDYQNFKVVLVDNNSDDGSVSCFKNKYENIHIIALDQNTGFTGGNNAGITWALKNEFDYVLLLNNDTVISDSNFLTTMISALESEEQAGMACPAIYDYNDPDEVWYAGGKCSLWSSWAHNHSLPASQKPQNTGYATGCCLLAKSEMVQEIGLLNSAYFLSVEDVEWSVRAGKAGWGILFVPQASIFHKGSMSSRSDGKGMFSPARIYYEWRNSIWFIREYGNSVQKYVIWPLQFGTSFLYKTAAYLLLRRWKKLKAMKNGIKKGIFTRNDEFKNSRE